MFGVTVTYHQTETSKGRERLFLLTGSVHGGGKGMVDCTVGICGGGVMVVQGWSEG